MKTKHLFSLLTTTLTACVLSAAEPPPEPKDIQRFVAAENVCAWPNLTVAADGNILAMIFNQPSHGSKEGDIECWSSRDGRSWKKLSAVTAHKTQTVRINLGAGRAKGSDLVALVSGWTNIQQPGKKKQAPFRDVIIRGWVCRSQDNGQSWKVTGDLPANESGMTELIPFGDIAVADDGSLRVSCYAGTENRKGWKSYFLRSDDDGRTWKVMSVISDKHNETTILRLGQNRWLAAARATTLDLFRSEDDGRTWQGPTRVTERSQYPADLLRMKDGRILLSYGSRISGQLGVQAKFSADEGKTWTEPLRIADSLNGDCGYPSSIELSDGKILTAFYSKSAANCERYHMGVAIWTLSSVKATEK